MSHDHGYPTQFNVRGATIVIRMLSCWACAVATHWVGEGEGDLPDRRMSGMNKSGAGVVWRWRSVASHRVCSFAYGDEETTSAPTPAWAAEGGGSESTAHSFQCFDVNAR